jgi:hypothetical protein
MKKKTQKKRVKGLTTISTEPYFEMAVSNMRTCSSHERTSQFMKRAFLFDERR